MKNGWQTKPLGELCRFIDYRGKTPEKTESGLRLITAKNVKMGFLQTDPLEFVHPDTYESWMTRGIPKVGDVLFTTEAPLANVCQIDTDERVVFAQRIIVLQPVDSVLDRTFLKYLLLSDNAQQRIHEKGTGATVKGIKASLLKTVEIGFPPLAEQRRIVGILDEAFEGLATAKANAEQNLQNARALFESGLNSATSGKLTHGWRCSNANTEHASSQLQKSLAERRRHWNGPGKYKEPDSPITTKPVVIPKSWTLASPEQIATHIVDCPHSTPKWTESGLACLRTTNFKPGFLDLESVQFVSDKTYRERIIRLDPKPGDVLYSREGGILGIACLIPAGLKACLGQRMMQFRLDTNVALPEFFTGVLNSTLILSEVKRLTGGAASPHLNIRDIRTFPIPLPPIAEQHEIVRKLNAVSEETQRLESLYQRKLAALDELKKSLLHRAFSGQL